MDEALRQEILEREKKHKKWRNGFYFWGFCKNLIHNVKEKSVGCIFIEILLFLICISVVGDFLTAFAVLIVLNIVIYIAGRILEKRFQKKLENLEIECREMQVKYFVKGCAQFGIEEDATVRFPEDNLVVHNGYFIAHMKEEIGLADIFQLENPEDYKRHSSARTDMSNGMFWLTDKIASVEFKKKFAIRAMKDMELQWIEFFSPTMQVAMNQSKAISAFTNIQIQAFLLTADTGYKIPAPSNIMIFEKKPLMKYFEEIDKYCAEVYAKASEVRNNVKEIDFLLGKEPMKF